MAAGRACTGFSLPYVATYANSSGTISYSGGMKLARGVRVSMLMEVSDDNEFWADNQAAENDGGRFKSGEVTLVVDGLKDAAAQMIFGVDAPTTPNTWTKYGDDMTPPYVGIGYIARYQSEGIESFVPVIVRKARFRVPDESHETQDGAEKNWQTESLTASMFRDDSSNHEWKWVGTEEASESAAEGKIKTALGITTSGG